MPSHSAYAWQRRGLSPDRLAPPLIHPVKSKLSQDFICYTELRAGFAYAKRGSFNL